MGPPIVFFGTPIFAAQILDFLIDHKVPIEAIVTQPDRPKGRSLQSTPSAVKTVASRRLLNVPIYQPEKCSDSEFLAHLYSLKAKLYVVVAFGQILPQKLLQIPPLGCINVHASLLPKYRGAAPIQRCLMNGDVESGVAIQKMVKELDAGDVIAEARLPIGPDITYGELESALCELSKPLLMHVIHLFEQGIPPGSPQDPRQVSYAAKISAEEGEIHWEKDAIELHNLIRSFNPRPGAWCHIKIDDEKKRLKIFRSKVVEGNESPGTLLSTKDLMIACGRNALHLLEVQSEGKPRMNAADWLRGTKRPLKFM